MSNSTQPIDPRKDISHEICEKQTYRDERNGEKAELVYLDDEHALLKYEKDGHALLSKRRAFDSNVGAGRFTVQGDVEYTEDESHTPVEFENVAGVGATTATSLRKNGFSTVEDIERATTDELLACRGLGEGNLENIREYINEET